VKRSQLIALTASFLPPCACLAGGTNVVGHLNVIARCDSRIAVTQDACQVFSAAQNRLVDRSRLLRAAQKRLSGEGSTNCAATTICGMQVERISYIGSNKVEAVFSLPGKPY